MEIGTHSKSNMQIMNIIITSVYNAPGCKIRLTIKTLLMALTPC